MTTAETIAKRLEQHVREALQETDLDELGMDVPESVSDFFSSQEGETLLKELVREEILRQRQGLTEALKSEVEDALNGYDASDMIQEMLEDNEDDCHKALVSKTRELALARIAALEPGCDLDDELGEMTLDYDEVQEILGDKEVQTALMAKARELALKRIKELDESDDLTEQLRDQIFDGFALDQESIQRIISDRQTQEALEQHVRQIAIERASQSASLEEAIDKAMANNTSVQRVIEYALDEYSRTGGLERLMSEWLEHASTGTIDPLREKMKQGLLDRLLDRVADRMIERMRL